MQTNHNNNNNNENNNNNNNNIGVGGKVHKNYERWSHEGRTKQKLKIGGIFPKSGDKYVAPELMPGKFKNKTQNPFKLTCSSLSSFEPYLTCSNPLL